MQNGKHAVARGVQDGFGFASTEFHVIRPGPGITSDWVHMLVRRPDVLAAAVASFKGSAGQQRVPPEFLQDLIVSCPSTAEQGRIAKTVGDLLARVERARTAAEARVDAVSAMTDALLRAAFGSPDVGRWPRKPLGEVADIVSGITLGRQLSGATTRSVHYLRVANVKAGRLDLSDVYQIEATEAEIAKLRLKFGDLLLTEGGDADKLGRGTFWRGEIPECIHQNHIFRVRFDLSGFHPEFVAAQFNSRYGKVYFAAHAKQTTGIATINRRVLAGFPLMVPPLSEQERIVSDLRSRLESIERLRGAALEELSGIKALPAALLREAFGGRLA